MNQDPQPQPPSQLSDSILSMLACPVCDSRPKLTQEGEKLICNECQRHYPIIDGIPALLTDPDA